MAKKNQLEVIDEQIKKKQDKMFVLKGQIDTLADEVKEQFTHFGSLWAEKTPPALYHHIFIKKEN